MLRRFLLGSWVGLLGFGVWSTLLAAPAVAATVDDAMTAASNAQVSADSSFMLLCAALVLLMTPGLAFFYGGFVRSRNILNTMMMSFVSMGIVGVTWILWGYSLAFSPGNSFIGGLEWFGMNDWSVFSKVNDYMEGSLTSYSATIPHYVFAIYQCMFAIITPALISGALVERMTFKAWFWFCLIWATVIYLPMAHMVWGVGGFLGLNGTVKALDFAGGTVVHISSGISALVAAWVLGPRRSYPHQIAPPHNVVYIVLGAGLLWFGWFGFNAGSALASGTLSSIAFVTTNTSAAAAALVWIIAEWIERGKPTAVGFATGAVAGLVGITPAAGFVTPLSAIVIGSITAVCCYLAVNLKAKLQFDDSLDTFPVHGVGGTVGALLTGLFATKAVNGLGADGLFYGNPTQLGSQLVATIATYLFAGIGTFIILQVLKMFMRLRVNETQEQQGLDINAHGEEAYGTEMGSIS
jgi:ammonium transporter, Amt family